jgi:hypothetical protein
MSVVWKYALEIADEQELSMPQGAELLHVANLADSGYHRIALWARVIPSEAPYVRRSLLIRGTGHRISTQPYIGTVVTNHGALVWHVFDGGEVTT